MKKKLSLVVAAVLIAGMFSGCEKSEKARYAEALQAFQGGDRAAALETFRGIETYEDSSAYVMYLNAMEMAEAGDYENAASSFETISGFLDSEMCAVYYSACMKEKQGDYLGAEAEFKKVSAFRDGKERMDAAYDMYVDSEFSRIASIMDYYTGFVDTTRAADMSESDILGVLGLAYRDKSKSVVAATWKHIDAMIDLFTEAQYPRVRALIQLLSDNGLEDYSRCGDRCDFAYAKLLMGRNDYEGALNKLAEIPDYEETAGAVEDCHRAIAEAMLAAGETDAVERWLDEIPDYDWKPEILQRADYAIAVKHEDEGDYAAAVAIYTRLNDYADSAERVAAYVQKYVDAETLLNAGDHAGALRAFRDLGNYSDSETRAQEARYRQAEVLLDSGDFDGATAIFNAIAGYADAEDRAKAAQYAKAEVCLSKGDYDTAAAIYESISGYADAAVRVLGTRYAQGLALQAAGDYDGAEQAFIAAADYETAPIQVLATRYAKAEALLKAGDHAGAAEAFTAAGDYADAAERAKATWYACGELRSAAGEWEAAREAFANAGDFADASSRISDEYYAEGTARLDAGDHEGAISALSCAVDRAGAEYQILRAHYAEGIEYMNSCEFEAAIGAFTAADNYADANIRVVEAKYQRANQLKQAGDYAQAYLYYADVLSFDQKFKDVASIITSDKNIAPVYQSLFRTGEDGECIIVKATGDVNFRSGPGLEYDRIAPIFEGMKLEYLGERAVSSASTIWSKVSYFGMEGWVSGKYTTKPYRTGEGAAAEVKALMSLKMRAEPDRGAQTVAEVDTNADMDYLGETRADERAVDWYKVRYDGTEGWVSSLATIFVELN